jgi:hypothetical protein
MYFKRLQYNVFLIEKKQCKACFSAKQWSRTVVHERVFEWLCKYDGLEEIKKQSQEHLKDNSKVCKIYSCSSIEAIVQFSDYFRSRGGFCHQLN